MEYDSIIYLPVSKDSYACFAFQNSETIRAYKTMPTNNSQVNYKDFYINSHYLTMTGTQNFSQYSTLPTCIEKERITDAYSYRNDFADIMLIVTSFVILFGFVISFIIKQFFKRR